MRIVWLTVVTVLVLFWRRPHQFLRPYIWCEDGSEIVTGYAARGLQSLFEPVSGYLITSSRVLNAIALKLSFLHYPAIAAALAIAFTAFVVCAIALSPTVLKWRTACAVVTLLVPTGAENYGVALYSFWWAGLLLLLAVLWRTDGEHTGWRIAFVIISGLSSPLIIPFAGVLAARAVYERRRSSIVVAAIALGVALIQMYIMLTQARDVTAAPSADLALSAYDGLRKLFGNFIVYRWWRVPAIRAWVEPLAGVFIIGLMLTAIARSRRALDYSLLLLVVVYGGVLSATVLRTQLSGALDIDIGGPRYFFYPWITMTWMFWWLAQERGGWSSALILGVLLLAFINGSKVMVWKHDPISWRDHVAECEKADHEFPLHFVGKKDNMWSMVLTRDQCQRLLDESLF